MTILITVLWSDNIYIHVDIAKVIEKSEQKILHIFHYVIELKDPYNSPWKIIIAIVVSIHPSATLHTIYKYSNTLPEVSVTLS